MKARLITPGMETMKVEPAAECNPRGGTPTCGVYR
jgi:hypothetical protein